MSTGEPQRTESEVAIHELKVAPPYFDALVSGSKAFEVRKNDRAYQRGDILRLREWHVYTSRPGYDQCDEDGCQHYGAAGHWATLRETVEKVVTFVYAGDPRFGGIEPGYVVLGLGKSPRSPSSARSVGVQ